MHAASFASWTQWLQLAYLGNALMVVAIRVAYQRRARRKTTTLSTPSTADAGLRAIALMSVLALPLVVLLARGFSGADYQLPRLAGAAGIPVILLGTWLFWRAHHDLGLNWSARLRIRADHTLVTEGIYKSIRHPMYAAVLVFGVGQFLLLQNWIAGPMLLVMALVFLVVRVPAEEAMMLRQFGDQYRHYMEQTGRILPKWWNR
jgi:protein-S-isoprenylcysteine O-methyltransferase Ste14